MSWRSEEFYMSSEQVLQVGQRVEYNKWKVHPQVLAEVECYSPECASADE